MFFITAIGGDTLDESGILKEQLRDHPDVTVASEDTVEYAFQELRQNNKDIIAASGARHQTNDHTGFNKLLVTLGNKLNLLNSSQSYMMDYDGHITENSKADNAFTYKETEGYYPVVCSINKLPVYMQNRNGNTPESYGQQAIIKAAVDNCRQRDIHMIYG